MELANDLTVADVRIGLGYSAVLLEDRRAGVAYTFLHELGTGCSVFRGLRPLAGRRASDLLALFDSPNLVESSIALATSNALSNTMDTGLLEGDVLDHVKLMPIDSVAMVGYFRPLVCTLRKMAGDLRIFEQVNYPKGESLAEHEAYEFLPKSQVALITSTSILNHTVDELLIAARSCREVALLVASTPLIREAFEGTSVTILSGVVIRHPGKIMRIVSEGGGMRLFGTNVEKVSLRV
jgi:uncharacterized protein (DUF4213/DUF364 family)